MNNKTKIIGGGVIIAVIFFYAGYAYAGQGAAARGGMRTASMNGGFGTFARTGGQGGTGRIPGGFSGGVILAKDAQSLTVKAQDGSSRIIFWSPSTQVMKTVQGTDADLSVGQMVVITGTQNPDGSLTAQSIQVRPPRTGTSTAPVRQ